MYAFNQNLTCMNVFCSDYTFCIFKLQVQTSLITGVNFNFSRALIEIDASSSHACKEEDFFIVNHRFNQHLAILNASVYEMHFLWKTDNFTQILICYRKVCKK